MTDSQIATLKAIRADWRRAQDAYHACLASGASDADRHAAERRCTAGADAVRAFMASL